MGRRIGANVSGRQWVRMSLMKQRLARSLRVQAEPASDRHHPRSGHGSAATSQSKPVRSTIETEAAQKGPVLFPAAEPVEPTKRGSPATSSQTKSVRSAEAVEAMASQSKSVRSAEPVEPTKRRASEHDKLAMLMGANEKKRRLIEQLLGTDAGSSDENFDESDADDEWAMPVVTADRRTASAKLCFDHRVCEVQLTKRTRADLVRFSRVVFSMGGSNWHPCNAQPRCLPERLALAVFEHHTQGATFDPARSGAEWWAQVRQCGATEDAIKFHWDADEFAVERHGVNLHPHLSTVTYLTDSGAPTLIVDRRNALKSDDKEVACGPIQKGMLSYPRSNKHIVFDGQLLHGAVPELGDANERITFLVNVWLNHQPSNCKVIDGSLAQHLGGVGTNPTLTDLKSPPSVKGDQPQSIFDEKFAWRNQYHRLKVPLPQVNDTAVIEWESGAELSSAIVV